MLPDDPGRTETAKVYDGRAGIHIVVATLTTEHRRPETEDLGNAPDLLPDTGYENRSDVRNHVSITRDGTRTNVRMTLAVAPTSSAGDVLDDVLQSISGFAAGQEAILEIAVTHQQTALSADPETLADVCRTLEESRDSYEVETLFGVAPDAGAWVSADIGRENF